MLAPPTGSIIKDTINIKTAATKLVNKNVINKYFKICPSLFIFTIFAMDDEIVKKTSGTTSVYIKFKNTSPNGFKTVASSLKMTPINDPIKTEPIKMSGKINGFNFFIKLTSYDNI